MHSCDTESCPDPHPDCRAHHATYRVTKPEPIRYECCNAYPDCSHADFDTDSSAYPIADTAPDSAAERY